MFKKFIFIWAISFELLLPAPALASYLYFSPSEINTNPDSNFDVQIKLNTLKDNINAATININYPSDILSVAGISYDKSVLGIPVESSSQDGLIKITRGSFISVNGDVTIGTITFQPQKTGTFQLSFGSGSKVPRLYDFSDSLDQSQNGMENITITASSSSNDDSSKCATRESFIKTNSKKIVDSGENILTSIDHVSQSVQNYSPLGGQSSADYQFKIANIQLQKSLARQNLKTAQNDLNSFECSQPNSKTKIAQFKKDITSLKQSLKNYRQSVKDLIGVLLTK